MKPTLENHGDGRYHVRQNGQLLPGIILGGNGRWIVQSGGEQWPEVYKSRAKAAAAIVANATLSHRC